MPRAAGFMTGDLDPSFPADPKFRVLARAAANYYSATGVYFHVVAEAWRTAKQPFVREVCPDADENDVQALIIAGLLDPAGQLPTSAFESWPGAALARRRKDADRKASTRVPRSPQDKHDVTRTPVESSGQTRSPSPRARTPTGQDRTGQDTTSLGEGGPGGEPLPPLPEKPPLPGAQSLQKSDAFDAYWQLAGKYPAGKAANWLDELVATYGDREVGSALAVAAMTSNNGNLLGQARDILMRDARLAEKATKAAAEERAQTALAKVESMPAEQRAANLGRLAEMMRNAGKVVSDPEEVFT